MGFATDEWFSSVHLRNQRPVGTAVSAVEPASSPQIKECGQLGANASHEVGEDVDMEEAPPPSDDLLFYLVESCTPEARLHVFALGSHQFIITFFSMGVGTRGLAL